MSNGPESLLDPIIECVPNFSEGADAACVRSIILAMRVEGVRLLDWSMDAAHNRSVVTIAGPPQAVLEAAIRAAGRSAELIDLTQQSGVHPRIGAADVIPFVPIANYSLDQCAVVARQAGMEIWRRYGVPAYFYEAAAARPDRANLEDVRRGQFEGLRDAARREPARRPDVGGPELHPTAGASAVGARRFLIAYNIFFDTGDISAVRAIARELRASSGGLKGVKALGVVVRGRAQLTINITDFQLTPVSDVYAAVSRLGAKYRATPVEGEIIGLIPEAACERNSEWMRQVSGFEWSSKVLEERLAHPLEWPTQG